MKKYFEVRVNTGEGANEADQVIARLAGLGFDGFVEEDDHVLAYREKTEEDEAWLQNYLEREGILAEAINVLDDKNWNAAWESDYQAVRISDEIMVRAPFHDPVPGIEYDIVIEPRMAFGTAHHETTSQMLNMVAKLAIKGKSVLDMGCGTAVLAILASKMGAGSILAVDNDEWAYQNALDNVHMNGTENIEVVTGDAGLLRNLEFDIIIANINRNILLEDMPAYCSALKTGGKLLMSGFYDDDLTLIRQKAEDLGMKLVGSTVENRWVAAEFGMF